MSGSAKIMTAFLAVAVFVVLATALSTATPSDSTSEFTSYYDQLNVNEKAVFDAVNSAGFDAREISVTLPISLTTASDSPDDAKTYLEKEIKSISDNVFVTLRISSPLAYWGWDANVVLQPTSDLTQDGDTFTVTELTWTVRPSPPPGGEGTEGADIEKMVSDLKAEIEKFHTDGATMRDKISDINNYLVDLITYDPNAGVGVRTFSETAESRFTHDAYGALVDSSHYAVCDGYSKAFLLLCQKEGIECVVVFGTAIPGYDNHAWNYVKMDNDKWYAVDTTWNDDEANDNPYFLLGGDEFFTTHSQGVFIGNGIIPYSLNSPILSDTNYDADPVTPGYHETLGWAVAAAIIMIIAAVLVKHAKEIK